MKSIRPPMELDIGAADLRSAIAACVRRPRPAAALPTDAVACLSVRTAFDLWLRAMAFAPGDEIAMSAVTLPDMVRIVEGHGLVPVPIDLDPATMGPRPAEVAAALGPRTRAVVIAHLFGGRVRLREIAAIAGRHGTLLVEDCAQAFAGDGCPRHPHADVSLYSFGPIKTATALGGAVARVRDPAVRARMRSIAAGDPVQSRRAFALRAVKYAALRVASRPAVYGAAVAAVTAAGGDTAALAKRLSRGFGGGELFAAIRRRPSSPLLALLERRLADAGPGHVASRAANGQWLRRMLPRWVEVPGAAALAPTWWLFPVAVADPAALCDALRAAGFDASRGTTSLAPIAPPPGRSAPVRAQALMEQLVYLPVSSSASPAELRALAEVVRRAARPRVRPRAAPAAKAPLSRAA